MPKNKDNVIIRKRIIKSDDPDIDNFNNSNTKKRKKPAANPKKNSKYSKQFKALAVLMFLFSLLLFLALLSYTPNDEANADISILDLFGLITGDAEIQAKAETANNWLGLFGAVIANLFYNLTIGYSILLLPFFIALWGKSIFFNYSIDENILKRTIVYLIIGTLLSGLLGTFQQITWMPDMGKEWSGLIGQFLSSVLIGIIGTFGSTVVLLAAIVVTIILGTNIKLDWLADFLKENYEKAKAFVFKKSSTYTDSLKNKVSEKMKREKPDENLTDQVKSDEKEVVYHDTDQAQNSPDEFPDGIESSYQADGNSEEFSTGIDEPARIIKRNLNINIKKDQRFQRPENEMEVIPSSKFSPASHPAIEENSNPLLKNDFDQGPDMPVEDGGIGPSRDNYEVGQTSVDQPSGLDLQPTDTTDLHDREPGDSVPGKKLIVTVNEKQHQEFEPDAYSPLSTFIHDEKISYKFPNTSLLIEQDEKAEVNEQELKDNANILQEKLETFKIYIENLSVTPGPVVTQYEFVPAAGIKISKIESLSDDLAMALKARGIRIIAPIPGKGTVGIEIPNQDPSIVRFSSVIKSAKYHNSKLKLPLALGKTISGDVYSADLTKMPHLLIAGATGSGKSVGINTVICSLLFKMHPSKLKFVIIDPKKVELQQYSHLKNHFLAVSPDIDDKIVTNPKDAVIVLKAVVAEMEERYDILAGVGQRNILEYNDKVRDGKIISDDSIEHRPMPYIVVIIDELADLMMTASKEVEEPITRLAQMARAVGIHLVVATQRPSVDVITGIIKANFPARIAYLVAQKVDSRTILDVMGAEQLLGNGDMLVLPNGSPKPIRVQNSFISTDEVDNICNYIKKQKGYSQPYMLPSLTGLSSNGVSVDIGDRDPLFEEAARLIIRHQQGSVSLIQRRLKVGYARAGRIVDELEQAGVVGPFDGSKARLVLMESESDLEAVL